MDITRGYLEDISRPAGSHRSRQRPGSRVSLGTPSSSAGSTRQGADTSNSLEILPPESPALDQQEFDLEVVELFSSDTDSECDAVAHSDQREGDQHEAAMSHWPADSNGHTSNGAQDCNKDGNGAATERTPAAPDPLDEIADPKMREAMKKMRQLDRILAKKVVKEKEVKRERLRAHRDLELELRGIQPEGRDEQREVSENASRFLALVPPPSHSEGISLDDEPVDPVFQTQPPADADLSQSRDRAPGMGQANSAPGSLKGESTDRSGQLEADGKTQRAGGQRSKGKGQDNTQHGGSDFIQRNINLAGDAGNVIPMTDDEKKRLEELLQDMEMLADEETKSSGTDALHSLQLAAGIGYVPDACEQQALRDIDAKLKALLPSDDFERISSATPSQESDFFYQGSGHVDPGEKVLKDTKDDRTQQERLKRIEDELESLESRVEREINKSPRLSQEKLSDLLEQCSELSSRAATETDSILQASPRSGHGAVAAPSDAGHDSQEITPRLADDVLQRLLAEARDSCLSENRLTTGTPRGSPDSQPLTSRSDGSVRSQFALVPTSTIRELLRNPRATSSVASTTGTIMDMAERGQVAPEGNALPRPLGTGPDRALADFRVLDGHRGSSPDSDGEADPDVGHRQSEPGDSTADGPSLSEPPLWDNAASPRRLQQQSPQPPPASRGQTRSAALSLCSVSSSMDFRQPPASLKSPEPRPPPPSRKRRSRARKAVGPESGGAGRATPGELSASLPQPPEAAGRGGSDPPRRGARSSRRGSESAEAPPPPLSSPGSPRRGSRARKACSSSSSQARSSLGSQGAASSASQRTDSRASTNTLVSSSDFEYEDDEAIAGQLLTRSLEAEEGVGRGQRPKPKEGRPAFGSSALSRNIEQTVARSIVRFETKADDKERFSPPLV